MTDGHTRSQWQAGLSFLSCFVSRVMERAKCPNLCPSEHSWKGEIIGNVSTAQIPWSIRRPLTGADRSLGRSGRARGSPTPKPANCGKSPSGEVGEPGMFAEAMPVTLGGR